MRSDQHDRHLRLAYQIVRDASQPQMRQATAPIAGGDHDADIACQRVIIKRRGWPMVAKRQPAVANRFRPCQADLLRSGL
jgi:hypothetical protein